MRKIGIYVRVSTEEQAKNKEGSLTSQIQRLQMKVEEKNRYNDDKWGKVVDVYRDEAFSGKNMDRPEFQRMLTDIKRNRIDTILVTELSRLSRSVPDFLNFINDMEKLSCDFICLQYDFDTTSPAGKVFMTIIMALSQFERELTAERIKNNFYARALRGLSNGGRPTLGYNKDPQNPGSFLVNKDEVEIVKDIFEAYLEGYNFTQIAGMVYENHGGACENKKFDYTTIWRILSNPAYTGKREVNKLSKDKNQIDLKVEKRYSMVKASWDAIIDDSTFENVQTRMEENKQFKSPSEHDFILSGFVYCDECGKSIGGQSGTGKYGKHFYYGHKKKTNCKIQRYQAHELESIIKKQLFSMLNISSLNEEFKLTLKELSELQPKNKMGQLNSKEKDIIKTKTEIDKLTHVLATNTQATSIDSVVRKLKESEEILKKLEQEKEVLQGLLAIDHDYKIDQEFVLEGINTLRSERFRKAKIQTKKEIAKNLIKSIHINPDNVIRIDLWSSEKQSEALRKASEGQIGVVLPFKKQGRPLEASFATGSFGGEKFAEIKKATEIGIYLGGFCNVVGSSVVAYGGR